MPVVGTHWPILHNGGAPAKIDTDGRWVGSKTGIEGDLVTVDANGRYDQAVAVSNDIADATRIAYLNTDILSSVAADGACSVQKFDGHTVLELQACDNTGAAVATSNAMKGDLIEIFRRSDGQYVANTSQSVDVKVEVLGVSPRYPVGEVGGTLLCRVLETERIN